MLTRRVRQVTCPHQDPPAIRQVCDKVQQIEHPLKELASVWHF
jgi:hypothetical protein